MPDFLSIHAALPACSCNIVKYTDSISSLRTLILDLHMLCRQATLGRPNLGLQPVDELWRVPFKHTDSVFGNSTVLVRITDIFYASDHTSALQTHNHRLIHKLMIPR